MSGTRSIVILACLGIGHFPTLRCEASAILNITQVGSDVTASLSGSVNLSGFASNGQITGGGEFWGAFPQGGSLIGAGAPSITLDRRDLGSAFTGSTTTFGSGSSPIFATSGTGTGFDIEPNVGRIYVPIGYLSGGTLSATSTWSNTTIATLKMTPGTYTWHWGTGGNADSFTLNIGQTAVPEPSTWMMAGLIAVGAGLVQWRRWTAATTKRGTSRLCEDGR
jgi:hypothetical protein